MSKHNHVSQQTHINRVPLVDGIKQAVTPRKRQNALFDKVLHQSPTQEPIAGPIHKPIEGQPVKAPNPLLPLPGFFMEPVRPASSGGYKYPVGCVIFRVAFIHKGRRFSKYIGHDGDMSAAEARAIAAKIIADVKTGRRHKLITPQERQFENFGRLFFTRYRHNWKPVTLAGSQRVFNDYLVPWFTGHAVDHISPGDVQRWFAALHDKPGAANRSLALLSVMMREAERYGYRDANTNPCKGMRRYRLRKQERFLSDDEYRHLGRMLAAQDSVTPLRVAMIRLLLLTGCRKSEIRTLKWSYYRTGRNGRKHLYLPDSKTGPKTIYLSAPARTILDSLPRTSAWVFPTTIKRKRGRPRKDAVPFFDIDFWNVFRSRAGLDDVRLHDLRHSYASLAIRNGVSLVTLGRLLGHVDPETTLQYTHLTDGALGDAVEMIAQSFLNEDAGEVEKVLLDTAGPS